MADPNSQDFKTGANGGTVSTNGMPSGQAQQTDANVNAGKASTGRS